MRRIVFIMLTVLFCPLLPVLAQSLDNTVKQRLTDFFKNYQTSHADIAPANWTTLSSTMRSGLYRYMRRHRSATSLSPRKQHRPSTV